MPPGQWAAWWLLQELANRGLSVDTLVLSGEPAVRDDRAMRWVHRLVVKDKASSGSRPSLRGLAQGAEARSIFGAAQLPTPVALPYQRMRVPTDPETQLFATLATAEAVCDSASGRLRSCAPYGARGTIAVQSAGRAIAGYVARGVPSAAAPGG